MGLRGRNNLIAEEFFFVTTTVINFTKIFSDIADCDILINNIKYYQQKYNFEILAYAIMPSHFHWILKTDISKGTVSDIMRDIKKYSAWDILGKLKTENSVSLNNFIIASGSGQKHQLWMHRFDDEVIRNEKMLWSKIKYIHNNPVEAGIVDKPEEYKYSSARNYINDDQSILYIEKCWAGIDLSRNGP